MRWYLSKFKIRPSKGCNAKTVTNIEKSFTFFVVSYLTQLYQPKNQITVWQMSIPQSYLFPHPFHTLSGRTGSALVWHTRGRVLESRLVQHLLRFVSRVSTMQYVELMEYCPWGWVCDQSIGSNSHDAILRSWLWSTATGSSPFGYFSILLQVVGNWLHILC